MSIQLKLMMNKYLLALALFLSIASSNAQDLKISFQTGYGFYDMNTFKDITKDANESLAFETKIISNYPPYNYYQPMIIIVNNKLELGFFYLFQTTGSRISSVDYSGEYLFDSKINSHSPGILIGYEIKEYDKISIGLNVLVGFTFNTLKFNESLKLNKELVSDEENTLTSENPYFKPNLKITYSINRFSSSINVGYLKEFFRNNYTLEGARANHIPVETKFSESDIWDGIRIGISFSYTMIKNKE